MAVLPAKLPALFSNVTCPRAVVPLALGLRLALPKQVAELRLPSTRCSKLFLVPELGWAAHGMMGSASAAYGLYGLGRVKLATISCRQSTNRVPAVWPGPGSGVLQF